MCLKSVCASSYNDDTHFPYLVLPQALYREVAWGEGGWGGVRGAPCLIDLRHRGERGRKVKEGRGRGTGVGWGREADDEL